MASVNANTLYNDLVASIRAYAKKIVDEISSDLITAGNITEPLEIVDYDTFAADPDLPKKPTFGPSGLNWTEDGQIIEIEVMFGITMLADPGLFNLHAIASKVYPYLVSEQRIPFVNATTGVQSNVLNIRAGTKVMPVLSGKRPSRFFILTASCGETLQR